MSKRAAEAGFTLLETLVAVFALALLMTAGGVLLTSTLNTSQLVEQRLERIGKLEIATAHLRADLSGSIARLTRSARANEDGKSFFGGFPDRDDVVLGLVRSGRVNIDNVADRSQLLTVHYRYVDGQLIRRVHESPDRARQTPRYETVLIDGLEEVEVLFRAGGVSSARWELVLENNAPVLPDEVILVMTFETGERLSQSFLVGSAI